jgi:hypothetical protein
VQSKEQIEARVLHRTLDVFERAGVESLDLGYLRQRARHLGIAERLEDALRSLGRA